MESTPRRDLTPFESALHDAISETSALVVSSGLAVFETDWFDHEDGSSEWSPQFSLRPMSPTL
jgi:hypothetical protein